MDVGGYIGVMVVVIKAAHLLIATAQMQWHGLGSDVSSEDLTCRLYNREDLTF